jgi:hypothetical protein
MACIQPALTPTKSRQPRGRQHCYQSEANACRELLCVNVWWDSQSERVRERESVVGQILKCRASGFSGPLHKSSTAHHPGLNQHLRACMPACVGNVANPLGPIRHRNGALRPAGGAAELRERRGIHTHSHRHMHNCSTYLVCRGVALTLS